MKKVGLFTKLGLFLAISFVILVLIKSFFFSQKDLFPISEKEQKLNKIKLFLEKNQPDSAIFLLTSFLKENPDDFLAHFHLALAYYKKGDLSLSEYECQKAFELNPESQKAKNLLCDIRFEKGGKRWVENKKRKALSDFLFVLKNSDKKEKIEEIANLTGGRFKIERKTFDLVADYAPKFSPDGKKIAFFSDTSFLLEDYGLKKKVIKKSKIFIMDIKGGNKSCLTSQDFSEKFPSFSKDGKKIVYEKENITSETEALVFNYDRDIFLKDLENKKEKRLTQNDLYDGITSFSPDNKKILFVSDQYGGICILNLDTQKVKSLYRKNKKILRKKRPYLPFYPSFSPDGKKITFDAGFDKRKIYLMDSNDENLKCLSHLKNEDFFPSFSPDGRKIVFVSKRDGEDELYIMNSDGTKQKRLTYDGMVKKYPSFSPDGKTVAYVAKPKDQKDQYFEIYFLRLNQVISKEELIQRVENLKNASHILEIVL